MKYSIIMPYYKKRMLRETLMSYQHHYANRDDYEVIVLEDYKNVADAEEHKALMGIITEFNVSVPVHHVETNFENCYAPSKMFNYGVKIANGEYMVLTNPECLHKTNVLGQFDTALEKDPDSYVVASCFNGRKENGVKLTDKNFGYTFMAWYQHSVHIPRGLHWCSVMSREQYNGLGGFDEGYAMGFGREDVDFFRRVEESDINVVFRDDIIVIHISHPNIPLRNFLIAANRHYYASKWGAMDTR